MAVDLPILWRSDESTAAEYEEARTRMFNAKRPDKYPRAIVKASTVDHVVAAVKLAAAQNTTVVTRSGGHGLASWTLRDDTILIDLQNLSHLSYDSETQIAQASPSTLVQELMEFLAKSGRYFPAGHCGDVGLGGYLLQAGIGFHARGYGFGCEWVTGLDVVTAEGEVVHCDENENPDLYWTARGAGPEFPAVVTRFYLKTMAAFPVQRGSRFMYPAAMFDAVFPWLDKVSGSLHDDVDCSLFVLSLPQINIPGIVVNATAFAQTEEEAREKLAPFVETRPPGTLAAFEFLNEGIAESFAGANTLNPHGHRYLTDSIFLKPGTDITQVGKEFFTNLPFGRSTAYWQPLRRHPERELPDMAMSISAEHYISLLGIWEDPAEDEKQIAWVTEGLKAMEPHIRGTFVADAHPDLRTSNYWTPEATERLVAIRNKWDPKRMICGVVLKDQ